MIPTPLTLPVKPSEAVALAELVFQLVERYGAEARARLASALPTLRLERIRALPLTLAADPVHQNTHYLAVWSQDELWLLHMAPASAPTSSIFEKPILLARVRPAGGREIIVNAVPVASNMERIVKELHPGLLARTAGMQAIWSVPAGAEDWAAYSRRSGVLPGVRGVGVGWGVYLGLLASPYRDGFVNILEGAREVPTLEVAEAYSRFRYVVEDATRPQLVIDFSKGLRRLLGRSFELELVFAGEVSLADVASLLDTLQLSNVAVHGFEGKGLAELAQQRHLGLTLEGEPTPGARMHWKGERWL
jgi:hypothetical protein